MLKFKQRHKVVCRTTIGCLLLLFMLFTFMNTINEGESEGAKEKNALTIQCNKGRLGNQMCSYAVINGLAELNHRNMSIMPCNFFKLMPYFDIKTNLVNRRVFKEHNPWHIGSFLKDQDRTINRTTNIIKGYSYPCSYTFFHHIRSKIIESFAFRPYILNYVKRALLKVKGDHSNVTFVGIHVRRTDYVGTLGGSWLRNYEGVEVDMEFFKKATQYFQDKYSNVLFIAVSDDRAWCRKQLQKFGIHVMGKVPSPAHDMAILSQCNHTIMTYGTFGFWGSYLAGGEVVYFDKFLKPGSNFTKHEFQFENMYLPEWIGITTNSSYS